MKSDLQAFFANYERVFNDALRGEVNLDGVSRFYSEEFIAAGPTGVKAGRNDAQFKALMQQGYARYRAMGTESMQVRAVKVLGIDEGHCVAQVSWRAGFRGDAGVTVIDFDVHYLMELREGEPKIFGWIAGDEEAILREKGVIQGAPPSG